jgi:hypothetical protein
MHYRRVTLPCINETGTRKKKKTCSGVLRRNKLLRQNTTPQKWESTQNAAKTTRKHAGSAVNSKQRQRPARLCVPVPITLISPSGKRVYYILLCPRRHIFYHAQRFRTPCSNLFNVTIFSFFISLVVLVQAAQSRSFPSQGDHLIYYYNHVPA